MYITIIKQIIKFGNSQKTEDIIMTEAKNLYQNRRSVYALGKNLPISEQEVLEIIDNAVK